MLKKTNRPCGDAEPIRFNSPIINNRADKPVSQQVVSYFFVCTAKIQPVCLYLCSKTVRFCIKTFKNALFIAFFGDLLENVSCYPKKSRVAELLSSATLKIKSNTMKNTHTKVYLIFYLCKRKGGFFLRIVNKKRRSRASQLYFS
jgi:hypothetical protein